MANEPASHICSCSCSCVKSERILDEGDEYMCYCFIFVPLCFFLFLCLHLRREPERYGLGGIFTLIFLLLYSGTLTFVFMSTPAHSPHVSGCPLFKIHKEWTPDEKTGRRILAICLVLLGVCFLWIRAQAIVRQARCVDQEAKADASVEGIEVSLSSKAMSEVVRALLKVVDWNKAISGTVGEMNVQIGSQGGKKIVISL